MKSFEISVKHLQLPLEGIEKWLLVLAYSKWRVICSRIFFRKYFSLPQWGKVQINCTWVRVNFLFPNLVSLLSLCCLYLDQYYNVYITMVFTGTPVAQGSFSARGQMGCCRPTPQPGQTWVWVLSEAYAAAYGKAGSSTHWARSGIKPTSSQRKCRVLNPLRHNRNASWL